MAIKTYTFTGKNTFNYNYSIQRLIYFWVISGLKGKIKSITLTGAVRVDSTISNAPFNWVLFKNFNSSLFTGNSETGWRSSNSSTNMYYTNTTASQKLWFNSQYYTNFGTILTNTQAPLSVTGGVGNVNKTITLSTISTSLTKASDWNGNRIFLGIYEPEKDKSGLIWGNTAAWTITITCQVSPSVSYYDGTNWIPAEGIYQYDGNNWIEITDIKYYNGNGWKVADG